MSGLADEILGFLTHKNNMSLVMISVRSAGLLSGVAKTLTLRLSGIRKYDKC